MQATGLYEFHTTPQDSKDWSSLATELLTGERAGSKITTNTWKIVETFQVSDTECVGIYKTSDGHFVRYDITMHSPDPSFIHEGEFDTIDKLEYTIKSEVGIIDTTKADCYGSATTEPIWDESEVAVNTDKWTKPLDVVIVQDLQNTPDIGDIGADISRMLKKLDLPVIDRGTMEHAMADSTESTMINKFFNIQLSLGLKGDMPGLSTYVRGGKLTHNGVLKMIELNSQATGENVFMKATWFENKFFPTMTTSSDFTNIYAQYDANQLNEFINVDAITIPEKSRTHTIVETSKSGESSYYSTVAQQEVFEAAQQDAQDLVKIRFDQIQPLSNFMVGDGLVDALLSPRDDNPSINDVTWHVGDPLGGELGTADRIVALFDKGVTALKDSGIVPIGIMDGLNQVDTEAIKAALKDSLDTAEFSDGQKLVRNSGKNTFVDVAAMQPWLEAWGTLFEACMTSCGGDLGIENAMGSNTFIVGRGPSSNSRVGQLTAALMKSSYMGYWVDSHSFVYLTDILTPAPRYQFLQAAMNTYFKVDDMALGSDERYYAHVEWAWIPTSDNIPREYIVSFPATGDFGRDGMYVYASFSDVAIPNECSANHLHSSISDMDAFMQSIEAGNPPPATAIAPVMHFISGPPDPAPYNHPNIPNVQYSMWDLIDPYHEPDGTLVPP